MGKEADEEKLKKEKEKRDKENLDKLIKRIQTYYDKDYKPSVLSCLKGYIERDIDPALYAQVFRYVLYYHPIRWGLPCVASVKKCIYMSTEQNQEGPTPAKRPEPRKVFGKQTVNDLTEDEYEEGSKMLQEMSKSITNVMKNKTYDKDDEPFPDDEQDKVLPKTNKTFC